MTEYHLDRSPCHDCEHRGNSKQGRFLSADGEDLRTNSRYIKNRKLKLNSCPCEAAHKYADYIASIFLCAPTRPEQTQYVGGNILDKSVKDEIS